MKNPVGLCLSLIARFRIMNLFSRDVYVVDEVLVRVLSGFFRSKPDAEVMTPC